MFSFGEMQVHEQAPWAYDAPNDLPKSHGLYLAAAGLVGHLTKVINPFATNGFYDSVNDVQMPVPTGKKLFVTYASISAQAGRPQMNLFADGGTNPICGTLIVPPSGGSFIVQPPVPFVVSAGETLTFQLYNIDPSVAAGGTVAFVQYVML